MRISQNTNFKTYKLSILMCTTSERVRTFLPEIVQQIARQAIGRPVQFLYLGDNFSMSVGEKRNTLLDMARGDYVVFADDDDWVSDDYVDELLKGCDSGQDVITHDIKYTTEGQQGENKIIFKVGTTKNFRVKNQYYWVPGHICAIRRDIAVRVRFRDINLYEDHQWAEELLPLIRSEHHLDKEIYHYRFSDYSTTTRQRR